MKDLRKILTGAALIVVQAMLIGLVANVLNPHGLPLFRSPLRDTHGFAERREVIRLGPPLKLQYGAKPEVSPRAEKGRSDVAPPSAESEQSRETTAAGKGKAGSQPPTPDRPTTKQTGGAQ